LARMGGLKVTANKYGVSLGGIENVQELIL
jgi:hypothetical protein